MGIIKYIPMVVDITMVLTEAKLRYILTVAVIFMELMVVKLRYILMEADIIMELMEAKDIYTQMERGADGSTGHSNSDGSGYFEDEYGDTVRY